MKLNDKDIKELVADCFSCDSDELPVYDAEGIRYLFYQFSMNEQICVAMRCNGATYNTIGMGLDCSGTRARQIYMKCLRKVRYAIENNAYTNITVTEDTDIRVLNLPTSALYALRRNNIDTVGDLITYSDDALLGIRGIGSGSLLRISSELHKYGFKLSSNIDRIHGGPNYLKVRKDMLPFIGVKCKNLLTHHAGTTCLSCDYLGCDNKCIFEKTPADCVEG